MQATWTPSSSLEMKQPKKRKRRVWFDSHMDMLLLLQELESIEELVQNALVSLHIVLF